MVKYILLCIVIGLSIIAWSEIPINRGPGIIADKSPKTTKLASPQEINFDGNTFSGFKKIEATVRVLEKDRYFFDTMSEFSSYDILVGWGQVSDQKNLDYINFDLKDRSFSYNKIRLPLKSDLISSQTLLWHVVPSTDEIRKILFGLRKGHLINVTGYIVDVATRDGLQWKSASSISQESKSSNKHDILWITSLTKK
ncbi:MAG TPA: hypothetical protein DCL80_05610 [Balneola sp.]|jgi:hypothetical protein|nr:hypothetical protein [Bacteroidota bacterium]MAC04314.1 hypothetical protein [Balneola sp.]MAO78329.1 hypothetical protein [Balneola sp.]MBF64330.1 hypothetical protein [Balneola sp.]HAH50759.1 hypothetical protein [Balneola sp.]|tara:strand:- start:7303 stop:7893 length:591 start_codon:yes stop_codon:yes gene_type:complete